jgi:hypothetical protein
MLSMSNAAAVNRVLLIRDTPGRAAGHAAKIRRYRLARVSLSSGTRPAPATRR